MDEREELLAQLHQLQTLVITILENFHFAEFSPRGSLLLDWCVNEITKLEDRDQR
jgi:hypothetical protein